MNITPVRLEGSSVVLEPLTPNHLPALCKVGLDPELWKWTTTQIRNADDMQVYVETALQWQKDGKALPFAILEKPGLTCVGSTRFAAIDTVNRHMEIGWTWISPSWQRTAINTEMKYLLLRHAFETLRCIRVEFKTDSLNQKSRAALVRIGAREEGTMRNHMITESGRFRHSVYFSIIGEEWPAIREGLESKLQPR